MRSCLTAGIINPVKNGEKLIRLLMLVIVSVLMMKMIVFP